MNLKNSALIFLVASGLAWGSATASAYEYPTVERVEFVEACVRETPDRPHQEMVYKCSCLLDQFAKQVNYDEFVDLSTAAKAFTVAGERGNALRDSTVGRDNNKRYKQIMSEAKKTCFIQ